MNTIALVLWSALMALFGLVTANAAHASELKVFTSVALTSVLDELAPVFEKATGTKLKIDYNLIAAQRKRILDGESADVIILSRGAMQELQKLDKFAASDLVDVAGTPVSVAARAGVPKPDISTPDAFKRTLLNARSIVYADPAKGGASGVYFARVLDRLGIAEQMQAKTILVPGAQAAEVVARGEAELGVAQGSEIVPRRRRPTRRPATGRICQHDRLYRRHRRRQHIARPSKRTPQVPERPGGCGPLQGQGLRARINFASARARCRLSLPGHQRGLLAGNRQGQQCLGLGKAGITRYGSARSGPAPR